MMDVQVKSLIAMGAAAAANCRPCLDYHVPKCIKTGAKASDIREAIETGFQVNRRAHADIQGYVEDAIADASGDSDDEAATSRRCC
jgi:AhpD family alkylhydroperoxidase